MKRKNTSLSAQGAMKFLFLESHGLRSPLTAIRWACGRLRKSAPGKLDDEQMRFVDHIYDNAKKLSAALESMLILAEYEDKTDRREQKDICLPSLLKASIEKSGGATQVHWNPRAPHFHIRADRELLEMTLRDILSVFNEAPERSKIVFVDVSTREKSLLLSFNSSLMFPVIRTNDPGSPDAEMTLRVGGIQGLMLSLANALAECIGGTVDLEEIITGEFIADGTVELGKNVADEHRIVLSLPIQPRVADQDCSMRATVA